MTGERAYVPREDPNTRRMVAAQAVRVQMWEKNGGVPAGLGQLWRSDFTGYRFDDCPHTVSTHVVVENPHGAWEVIVCVNCGEAHEAHCQHRSSTWNAAGTVLTCDNCGIDGT